LPLLKFQASYMYHTWVSSSCILYIGAQFSMARSKGNYNESKVHDKNHIHNNKWWVHIWLYGSYTGARMPAFKFTPPVKSTPSPHVRWYPF